MDENKYQSKNLSWEYIRGLVEGEGCFTFHTVGPKDSKKKMPTFAINMSRRDEELLRKVRNSLNLKSSVYVYPPRQRKDGYKRQGMAVLLVRGFGDIKNIIIPLFYKKLNGYKAVQFDKWINNIEQDPNVLKIYKLIPKLYKNGFYDRNFRHYD